MDVSAGVCFQGWTGLNPMSQKALRKLFGSCFITEYKGADIH